MAQTQLKEQTDNTTKKTETLISKIKLDKFGFPTIVLTKTNDKSSQEIVFTGKEEVTEDFKKKFNELKNTIVEIIPFLEDTEQEIKTTGLTIKYGLSSELKGIVITAQVQAQETILSPVNINTPYVKFAAPECSDEFTLCSRNLDIVEKIIHKTEAYMNGDTKTKQLSLVVDNSEVEE